MKKWIWVVLIALLACIFAGVYFGNKLPDNYLYDFDGTYKYSSVLAMYEYDDKIVAVLRNFEITQDSWDDDDCYDDMVNIAIFDDSMKGAKIVPLTETLTLENDGRGLRYQEVYVRSDQSNQQIYIQVSLYDADYMFVFDILTETYEKYVLEMSLDSFYIQDNRIHAVSIGFDEETQLYQVNYCELDLMMNVVDSNNVGSIFLEKHSWEATDQSVLRPVITSDLIVIQGNLIDKKYSYSYFSIYDFLLDEILLVGSDELFTSYYYVFENKLYYDSVTIHGQQTTYVYENNQFLLHPITSNGFKYGIFPTETFEFNYLDSDFFDQQVRLVIKETGEDIVIEYPYRIIYKAMYEFNGFLYVIASIADSQLSRFLHGTGWETEYVIQYKIDELLAQWLCDGMQLSIDIFS